MRPRVIPADDESPAMVSELLVGAASMRPRVIPADDDGLREREEGMIRQASMRPRVIPADDAATGGLAQREEKCFNEAAGYPRG